MTDLWMPGSIAVHAPTSKWGRYADGYPARGALHTTETDYYPPSTKSYFGHQNWPHTTIGQAKDGTRGVFSHIPLNRAARAAKNESGGVETNNASLIQTEIVWRASNAPNMPDWLLELIAKFMRFAEQEMGIKSEAVQFYGPDCGWKLASPTARQRMSAQQWNAYNGWCGHQHLPENSHWDPGAIPIQKLLNTTPSPEPIPVLEEDKMTIYVPVDDSGNTHDAAGKPIGPQILVQGNRRMTLMSPAEHDVAVYGGAEVQKAKPFLIDYLKRATDDLPRA